MTTDLVVTITDELVAELEANIDAVWHRECKANTVFRAILSERADLYSDIELLEHTIEGMHTQKAAHAGMASALLRSDKLLTEARREIAELKRDAGRYRFIVPHLSPDYSARGVSMPRDYSTATKAQCDAAIDQAMQERQK